jgi:hypothetical protein
MVVMVKANQDAVNSVKSPTVKKKWALLQMFQ